MKMKRGLLGITLLAFLFALAGPASAATYFLDATDLGWYTSDSAGTSYLVGYRLGVEYRNWFVFDLSGVSGNVTSATLEVDDPSSANNTSATWTLYNVSTPIGTLEARFASSDIFNDLGTGTIYGSANVPTYYVGIVTVDLNAAAIIPLTEAEGSSFAIGGVLNDGGDNYYIFGDYALSQMRRLTLGTDASINPWDMSWSNSFGTSPDAAHPDAGLIMGASGVLYGTTQDGGAYGDGTIFKIGSDGTGYQVLYSFGETTGDGASPYGRLMMYGPDMLYGTTYSGGAYGYGTVFEINTDGTGYQVLHSFKGGRTGSSPSAGLIMDGDGNLYGTTSGGGAYDYGTVFMLKTASKGKKYTVLHSFAGSGGRKGPDGAVAYGSLIMDGSGNLYGTTAGGGAYGDGTVFMLSTGKGKSTYTVLHSFGGTTGDGEYPWDYSGLIMDGDGNLYGTTQDGGANGDGTIFEISSDGNTYDVLYSFNGTNEDGIHPYAGLIMDGDGNLYGTTQDGGANGDGTVFMLTSSYFTVIYDFDSTDGASPEGSLFMDFDGYLYSTTAAGGSNSNGTVFKLSP